MAGRQAPGCYHGLPGAHADAGFAKLFPAAGQQGLLAQKKGTNGLMGSVLV